MRTRTPIVLLVLDVLLVVLFAAIGRSSHEEGLTLLGVVKTAAPFLVGLGLGWAAVRSRGLAAAAPTGTAIIWLVTVAGGMVVRRLFGEGTAWSFVIVSLVTLGLFLLADRFVLRTLGRRAGAASHG